ncbi:hypothetical protein EFA46_012335 (plasmid) [Halarchaeum sp. CBA1220]|uniref:hypothetical protein n=1 Tax=Halarchaeum sp. CBA1220 TaxID=1853682 RepID=UPI000F3A8BB9|nr:hypothetical protein [Halarchaeum sp. CBA1220]QLC35038.1 hypothetical protein EFA46_012335 [Halarchaeum sp. CBA1220]
MSDAAMAARARVVGRLRPGDCVRGRLAGGGVFDADVVGAERDAAGVRVALVPTGVSPASTRWRLYVPRTRGAWRSPRFERRLDGAWTTHDTVVELRRRCR